MKTLIEERYIYGFDKPYIVNKMGEVFAISKYDRKKMKPYTTTRGYHVVSFKRYGKNSVRLVHRLVAMAFIKGYKDGLQVNHKNGVKTDNRATNLEWVTPKENSRHSRTTGLYDNKGEKHSMVKLTAKDVLQIRELIKNSKASYSRIASWYKVNKTCIRKIAIGETWRHI